MNKTVTVRLNEKAHKNLKAQSKKKGMTLKGYFDFLAGVVK